jgi:hypothetical protein
MEERGGNLMEKPPVLVEDDQPIHDRISALGLVDRLIHWGPAGYPGAATMPARDVHQPFVPDD